MTDTDTTPTGGRCRGRFDCDPDAIEEPNADFEALLTQLRRPDRNFVIYLDDATEAKWATGEPTVAKLRSLTWTRRPVVGVEYTFDEETGCGTVTYELETGRRMVVHVVAVTGALRVWLMHTWAIMPANRGVFEAREVNALAEDDLPLYAACYRTELLETPVYDLDDEGAEPVWARSLRIGEATAFLGPLLARDPETKTMLAALMHAMDRPYQLEEIVEMLDLALLPGPT